MADAQTPVLADEQISDAWDKAEGTRVRGCSNYDARRNFARHLEAAILAAQAPAQPDRAVMQQALDAIAPRFRSGNAVPVEKAMVPAAEWHALVAALEKYLAP